VTTAPRRAFTGAISTDSSSRSRGSFRQKC
jgi:hypothetical protein